MSKPLRLDLPAQDAQELLKKRQEVDHLPVFRSLLQQVERALGRLRPAKKNPFKPRYPRRSSAARRRTEAWGDKELRAAIFERSEGRCECGCKRRITWRSYNLPGFEPDHFLGRARAPQSPVNTWALAPECHRAKTENKPSRRWWLTTFLQHLQAHGFGKSETAREVENQLEAERLLEKAADIRARQDAAARELVEQAKREEVAENVCENGDHPAPAGQRFCSLECQAEDAGEVSGG